VSDDALAVTATRTAPGPEPRTVGFFLVPDFALLPFASATEPLRGANWMSGEQLYDWVLISRDGQSVSTSNGIRMMPHASIADAPRLRTVIVVAGGHQVHRYHDKAIFGWLRRLSRTGCRIGAIGLGSYILARAGLLDGYRCTVHWEYLASFVEEFPHLQVTNEVYEIDRDRFTCSGGTGALDLMLRLIAEEHGYALATSVAEDFIHERIRDDHDEQRMALRMRLGVGHPKLIEAVEIMERTPEQPLPRTELAERVGLTTRQLERLFRRYLGRTPTRYYLELRLKRARMLLTQTSMSVLDVGLACGFVSASHFAKAYRNHFQRTPREERGTAL